jgi:hypothetical protein
MERRSKSSPNNSPESIATHVRRLRHEANFGGTNNPENPNPQTKEIDDTIFATRVTNGLKESERELEAAKADYRRRNNSGYKSLASFVELGKEIGYMRGMEAALRIITDHIEGKRTPEEEPEY